MPDEKKNQAIELLGVLAGEATVPREKRRRVVGMAMFDRLKIIIEGVSSLAQLWGHAAPLLQQLFL
jgi:hypothetical protein